MANETEIVTVLLFGEWGNARYVGHDVAHALQGRTLRGPTYYRDGIQQPQAQLDVVTVIACSDGHASVTRGGDQYSVVTVADNDGLWHEVDCRIS